MKKIQIITALSVLLLSACTRVDVYDTDHPNHGIITLTTDWSNISADIAVPQSYTVQAGSYSANVTGATNTIDNLFFPGNYQANVYNTADKITVNGSVATLATTGGIADPLPGWLFTSTLKADIEQDKEYHLTAAMRQQVRELNLVIAPSGGTTDRIESITASLSGAASTLDFANGTHSNSVSVAPAFIKQANGTWAATVRLLGITGNEQKLTITMTFTGNSPAPISEDVNIHTQLGDFNTDKRIPLTLGAQVVVTPTGAGFSTTITNWEPGNGSGQSGNAE